VETPDRIFLIARENRRGKGGERRGEECVLVY